MVSLEKEVKIEENKPKMNKWQTAWKITKDITPVLPYFVAIGLAGYFGYKLREEAGAFGAAIIVGVLCTVHQENGYSNSDDDGMIPG